MARVALMLLLVGLGCRSEKVAETPAAVAARAEPEDAHGHECLAEAERQWAARQRTLERSEVHGSAFAAPAVHSERESAFVRDQVGGADDEKAGGDLQVTQRIRQALFAEPTLSFAAKNVKIVTTAGRVTLRGAVRAPEERAAVEAIAVRIAGEGNVANEL